jgi:hypothetical protein
MGFRTPSFNLVCNIWTRSDVPAGAITAAPAAPPRITPDCQLRHPGKQSTAQDELRWWAFSAELLLPAGTDVRDDFTLDPGLAVTNQPDFVEVPAGSGRWYTVVQVEDVAKGFPNEYRVAMIFKNKNWPVPTP